MRYVSIVSERAFNLLAFDVKDEAIAPLWEMWRDDLSTDMHPSELVRCANGLLTYFGSKVLVTDVHWDGEGNCFLWEIEYND
jgi:hypothetical protein